MRQMMQYTVHCALVENGVNIVTRKCVFAYKFLRRQMIVEGMAAIFFDISVDICYPHL